MLKILFFQLKMNLRHYVSKVKILFGMLGTNRDVLKGLMAIYCSALVKIILWDCLSEGKLPCVINL